MMNSKRLLMAKMMIDVAPWVQQGGIIANVANFTRFSRILMVMRRTNHPESGLEFTICVEGAVFKDKKSHSMNSRDS